jgi:hypothetical protein
MTNSNHLAEFIDMAIADKRITFVRGRARAEKFATRWVRELRSKKNDFQAVSYDELGNAIVLDRKGNVKQLCGKDEQQPLGVWG